MIFILEHYMYEYHVYFRYNEQFVPYRLPLLGDFYLKLPTVLFLRSLLTYFLNNLMCV